MYAAVLTKYTTMMFLRGQTRIVRRRRGLIVHSSDKLDTDFTSSWTRFRFIVQSTTYIIRASHRSARQKGKKVICPDGVPHLKTRVGATRPGPGLGRAPQRNEEPHTYTNSYIFASHAINRANSVVSTAAMSKSRFYFNMYIHEIAQKYEFAFRVINREKQASVAIINPDFTTYIDTYVCIYFCLSRHQQTEYQVSTAFDLHPTPGSLSLSLYLPVGVPWHLLVVSSGTACSNGLSGVPGVSSTGIDV